MDGHRHLLLALTVLGYCLHDVTTLSCLHCPDIADPTKCTAFRKCHHDESCMIRTWHEEHGTSYELDCKGPKECGVEHHHHHGVEPIGRREAASMGILRKGPPPPPPPHGHHQECIKCCSTNHCNTADLCSNHTTTPTPTTTASTTVPTTKAHVSGGCVDHEEDGFRCSDYDKYSFCSAADGLSFELAHHKCRKHCGFCSYVDTTTVDVPTSTSANPHTSTGPQTAKVDVFATTASNLLCQDYEDSTFSCADWQSKGFCSVQSGAGHEVAILRCRKRCGFCS